MSYNNNNSIYVDMHLLHSNQKKYAKHHFVFPDNTLQKILYADIQLKLAKYKESIELEKLAYQELIEAKTLYTKNSGIENKGLINLSILKQDYYKAKENWINKANMVKLCKYKYRFAQSAYNNAEKIFANSFKMNLISSKYNLRKE